VDLEGSGLDPGILGFRVHLNSRVLTFCIMSPFCVNCVELNVDAVSARRLRYTYRWRILLTYAVISFLRSLAEVV